MRTRQHTNPGVPAGTAPAGVVAGIAPHPSAAPDAAIDLADLPLSPHATYRRLRMAGFTAREAGTLVGHLLGLRGSATGWAIEEVERLLFVRALVQARRMGS